ncbi:hypothetical protein A2U01_0003458 [Trifolium medium]|uniref:Retrotransposon gag domain-containing protein n=1 Tax=Trifolium medium TaxID=97028 RepID=A0A392M5H6_9FABA|nr:hypothetical protein [Trifolium medium]
MVDFVLIKERTLPSTWEPHSPIAPLEVEAHDFSINTSLITLVQNNAFSGGKDENAPQHLVRFLEHCDTFKRQGLPDEVVRLNLFPQSLKGDARIWFDCLQPILSHHGMI